MWSAQSDSRLFAGLVVALVGVAWLAYAIWGLSPYSAALDHEALVHTRLRLGGEYVLEAAVFAGGWALMTVAMMLPTSLPFVILFRTVTQRRANRNLLTALLLAGYLATWVGFGIVAHFGDFWLHRAVEASATLHANAWLLGAAPLLVAGVYQFTPLKYVCLDKCRSPYSFMMGYWRGSSAPVQSLRLGVAHGVFCVGCCWPLMLLMFAVGTGNLAWMLVLSVVMGVEKNFAWGRRLSAPLGAVLLSAGATLMLLNLS